MAVTGINSEDRLVQKTFADHLHRYSAGRASMPGTTRLSVRTVRLAATTQKKLSSLVIFALRLTRLIPICPRRPSTRQSAT